MIAQMFPLRPIPGTCYLDTHQLSDDVSEQPDPHTRHGDVFADDGDSQNRGRLIERRVSRDVRPHEREGGEGEGVDEEKSFVRMLSKLGVHALLVDAYINERKREL